MDLVSPCDALAPEWTEEMETDPNAELDWTAYENCWETNADADPWEACYTEGEFGTCFTAANDAWQKCYDEEYGSEEGSDDGSDAGSDDGSEDGSQDGSQDGSDAGSDDGSEDGSEGGSEDGDDDWVDPCPWDISQCGEDPCMDEDLVSPCDEFVPEMNDDPDTEQDWTAYDNCWETNADADPWAACIAGTEFGTCYKAAEKAWETCAQEAWGPMDGGDDSTLPPTDDMPAPPTDGQL